MDELTAYSAAIGTMERKAQNAANSTWFYGVLAAVQWYFWTTWWAAVPVCLALWCGVHSMRCTSMATKVRNEARMNGLSV